MLKFVVMIVTNFNSNNDGDVITMVNLVKIIMIVINFLLKNSSGEFDRRW